VLLDQKRVPGDVIVITASRSVARWARTVAHVATPLGTRLKLTPVVLHVSSETCERLLSEVHPELALIGNRARVAVARCFARQGWSHPPRKPARRRPVATGALPRKRFHSSPER
jgi:hypothetical protein